MNQIIKKYGNHPLSNFELEKAASDMKIKNFRGIFMRNELPKKPFKNERGILNLDDTDPYDNYGTASGNGTHWVCYIKKDSKKFYFDSFGLDMPVELENYLKTPIFYSTSEIQKRGTVVCGHYCLNFLKNYDL